MPVCPAVGCQRPITEGQATLKLSPGTLKLGMKSGAYYHSATFEAEIIIHYECVFRFFHPDADREMYDIFRSRVEEDVKVEILDDLKQEAYAQAAEDIKELCPECLMRRDDPDRPPVEYECSDCGSTAMPVCPNCGTVSDIAVDQITNAA